MRFTLQFVDNRPGDVVIYKCTIISIGGNFGGSTVFRGKSSPFVSCIGESIKQEEFVNFAP